MFQRRRDDQMPARDWMGIYKEEIIAEQVKQLYALMPFGIVATLLNSVILFFLLRKVIPQGILIAWLVAVVVITMLRIALAIQFRRTDFKPSAAPKWGNRFIAELILAGVVWGSIGTFPFSGVSLAHQVLIAFVLGGMAAGAAVTFSVTKEGYLAFSIPALLPLCLRFFLMNNVFNFSMGVMLSLFGLLLWGISRRHYLVNSTSLLLRFENRANYDRLRELAVHLQTIREEERANIAREIHDELGQTMTAVKMDLAWLNKKYADHAELFTKTSSTLNLIDDTIQTIKKICTELRPGILDHLGLGAAILWQGQEFQKRTGILFEVDIEEGTEVDGDRSIALFRIFQEALTNIMRHANASKVVASLKEENGKLTLKVTDDGKGITEEEIAKSNSFGLLGMRERVHPWKGNVSISGIPNKGTTITVTLPIE